MSSVPASTAADGEIRLSASGLPELWFTPWIDQTVTMPGAIGLDGRAAVEALAECPPQHRFEVVLHPSSLYHPGRRRSLLRPVIAWRRLRDLTVPETAARFRWRRKLGDDPELVLAQLDVTEFVVASIENTIDWFEALDGQALAGGELYEMVEALINGDRLDGALIDGSLFYLEHLHVHPAIRGQRVGVRLIEHALSVLRRSDCDLAVGLANPIRTLFEPLPAGAAWEPPVEARDRLVRYYRSAGFQVWRPRRRRSAEAPIVIYRRLVESVFPDASEEPGELFERERKPPKRGK